MNTTNQKQLTGLAFVLTTLLSTPASASELELSHPDTTPIYVSIKNLTNNTLSISKPSTKQATAPIPLSELDIQPQSSLLYIADFPRAFSSIAFDKPKSVEEKFAYRSGNKECQFSAFIEAKAILNGGSAKRIPRWVGHVESIGSEEADCSAEILQVMNDFPHGYSIEFTVK